MNKHFIEVNPNYWSITMKNAQFIKSNRRNWCRLVSVFQRQTLCFLKTENQWNKWLKSICLLSINSKEYSAYFAFSAVIFIAFSPMRPLYLFVLMYIDPTNATFPAEETATSTNYIVTVTHQRINCDERQSIMSVTLGWSNTIRVSIRLINPIAWWDWPKQTLTPPTFAQIKVNPSWLHGAG